MKRTLFSGALAIFFLISCSTVPLTGRRQLSLIPDSQINSLSFQNYQQVLNESRVVTGTEDARLVKSVGEKIAYAVEKYMAEKGLSDEIKGFRWEFTLIQEDVVNAWCMPGGKVAFYTGIMPICQNEEGVAVVMSHEIAHAIAEHGSERMSQQLAAQMGGTALSVALQSKPEATRRLANTAFGLGAQYGVLLPFGRTQESEADELGLYFMAMAGYNPEAAVPFWQRMAQQGGGQRPPEFLSTHPAPETRIRDIKQIIPKTRKYQGRYVR
ncbi:M48 family metallopeptidase [Tunicatimonas pelagia]|uniref:M48 family metallopeptidase n=1 Tax=Tunicatimonas pelagia TaxID=931531 RepID=UPI002666C25B|nr:M48 family metallopeptidase [Tunicatimonas pelagia]WKN40882.1 M48 family metallopeptidase [Tunicatimonas pelagia]